MIKYLNKMKFSWKLLPALLFISFAIASCSKSYVAQTGEYDDMYFTSVDRDKLEASSKEFYAENFVEDYKEPLEDNRLQEYSDVNYSSKTVNPEYIAKYTNEGLEEDEAAYFDDNYSKSEIDEITKTNATSRNNYSNYNSPGSGFGFYPSFSFGYGYSPWYTPYFGSAFSLTFSRGWGYPYSPAFRPYSGFYDPFYNPYGYYNPYRYGYGSRWDSYGYGSPYSPGYGYGSWCPSPYASSGGYPYYYPTQTVVANSDPGNVVSVRKVTRSPRTTRGTSNGTGNNNYRLADDNRVYLDNRGKVEKVVQNSSNSRNNYYRRTRASSVTTADTRGYQRSNSRSSSLNESTTYLRTRGTGSSSSGYSRSTRTAAGRSAAKSTGFRYGSTTNRSSSSSFKGSNLRSTSSSSYKPSSGSSIRSTPSRSGSSSRSSSKTSGATRTSGKRGGN